MDAVRDIFKMSSGSLALAWLPSWLAGYLVGGATEREGVDFVRANERASLAYLSMCLPICIILIP